MTAKTISGQIITIQEQRFRLVTDDGRGFLFTLTNGSPTVENLNRWQADGVRVDVEYTGEPNVTSGVAHAVRPQIASVRN